MFSQSSDPKNTGDRKTQPLDITAQRVKRNNPFSIIIVVVIAVIVASSLWIAATALMEKIRLSHELQQILDINVTWHDAYLSRHQDTQTPEDLIAGLERLGRIQSTGEQDGIKTLTNPWGGKVTAAALPGGRIHIETIVPAFSCQRVIDLFDENLKDVGLEQIDVLDARKAWQPVYVQHAKASPLAISSACSDPQQADVILTFSAR